MFEDDIFNSLDWLSLSHTCVLCKIQKGFKWLFFDNKSFVLHNSMTSWINPKKNHLNRSIKDGRDNFPRHRGFLLGKIDKAWSLDKILGDKNGWKTTFLGHFWCFLSISLLPVIKIFLNFIYRIGSTLSNTLQKLYVQEKSCSGCIVGTRPLFLRLSRFFGIFGVFYIMWVVMQ